MLADLLAARIYTELASRTGYAWDRASARYRNLQTGRYVSEASVRGLGERFAIEAVGSNIELLTDRFIDGKIDLETWQRGMAREIKDAHVVSAMLGRGGRDQMTQADWGRLGARLREQYRYLNRFAREIANGQLSPAQIRARAAMYARSARTSYFDGLTSAKREAGFEEEQRVLGVAEHCDDCPPLAGYWAPIGSLPPIGESQCLTNCRCSKKYRKHVLVDGKLEEVIG
jgi:hypothetical protein